MSVAGVLFGVGGAAVGGMLGYGSWQEWRKVRAMRETKTTRCAEVRDGLVEVKGAVSPLSEQLVSPLSKAHCVYFRFHVQEYVKRGKNSTWVTRVDDKQYSRVVVQDESGAVELELSQADLELEVDTRQRSGTFHDAPPELEETLAGYGQSSTGWLLNKKMRYTETVLEVGDPIYALGTVDGQGDAFLVLSRGPDGLFVVGDTHEGDLSARLRTRATWKALGALLAVGIGGAAALIFLA